MERFNSKWVATIASIWIQCSIGACYAFGVYSPTLKSTQNYDQSTLDTVSVFKDVGANAGVLAGLLYSFVTSNRSSGRFFGPWVVHLTGAVLCFVGYFLIWASVVGLIERPPVALMCLFMFVAAHAQTFFNTANVVTGVRNFGDYGGTIVGILKGFLGLSGAILVQVYHTMFVGNPSSFILFIAFLPTIVSLSLMFLVRIYDRTSVYDKKHLNSFSAIALIMAAYLMILLIFENNFTLASWAHITTFIFLLLLVVSPVGIAYKAVKEEDLLNTSLSQPLVHQEKVYTNCSDIEPQQDMNLKQAMCTANFWLLFFAMICGMGSGTATINNISQVGESLGYSNIEINSLVSLLCIWNFLGRFGVGYVSDTFMHKKGWPRPLFVAITQGTLCIGHLIVASGFSKNLYLGSILVGVCYGSQVSLVPAISSEIFGVSHMGTIFNTINAASPIGSYIFSVRIIGYIYDKAVTGDHKTCYGSHCFMLSFLIMAGSALFGSFIGLVLYFRTRKFYDQVVIKRLRHSSIS